MAVKQPKAINKKIPALKDLSGAQIYASEKKQPDSHSQAQANPITPATMPIGVKKTKPRTNLIIAADFPAIYAYNLSMLDEENSRLKGLLIATSIAYLLGWIIGLTIGQFVNTDDYIFWVFEHGWVVYLTWFFIFIGFSWMPLSIFLLVQGFILRKKYSDHSFTGDRTVGNLAVVVPIVFIGIYLGSRLFSGV